MAIHCPKYDLLFVMAPRTGSTAVGHILCEEFEGQFIPPKNITDERGVFIVQKKHSTIPELIEHDLISSSTLDTVIKFSTIRNPFDSLVSLYVKKRTKYQPLLKNKDLWVYKEPGYAEDMIFCRNHSFTEWIKKNYSKKKNFKTYLKEILRGLGFYERKNLTPFLDGVDFIMRFENLEEDFNKILEKAGIERKVKIPVINKTEKRKKYREYYTPESKKIVKEVYQPVLEKFNYSF